MPDDRRVVFIALKESVCELGCKDICRALTDNLHNPACFMTVRGCKDFCRGNLLIGGEGVVYMGWVGARIFARVFI